MDVTENSVSIRLYIVSIIGSVTFTATIVTAINMMKANEAYLQTEKLRIEERQQFNEQWLNDLENRIIKLESDCK